MVFQKPEKLLVAVPAEMLGDHRTTGHIEGGEQAGGAMAGVGVGHPLRSGGHARQDRRCPVQRLDLGLLVNGEDQRVGRRIEVEPDNVADFVHELWIGGQLPGLHQMRLEPKCPPDP
jgi:hypothetical protein